MGVTEPLQPPTGRSTTPLISVFTPETLPTSPSPLHLGPSRLPKELEGKDTHPCREGFEEERGRVSMVSSRSFIEVDTEPKGNTES